MNLFMFIYFLDDPGASKSSPSGKLNSESKMKKSRSSTKSKLLCDSESPLKEITCNGGNVEQSDSLEDFKIPIKRTPASTDLTKKTKTKMLSVKKTKEKENLQTICEDSRKSKFNAQQAENKQNFGTYRNTSSNSASPVSDSYDFGVPIQESTRIYSRASIDTLLDIPEISQNSIGQELNLSEKPLENSADLSYKQLKIEKVGAKRVSIGNFQTIEYKQLEEKDSILCSKLQNLDLTDSGSEETKEVSNVTGLYMTALCDSVSKERQEISDSSGLNSNSRSRKSDAFYFDAKSRFSTSSSSENTDLSSFDDKKQENSKKKLKNEVTFHSSEKSAKSHNEEGSSYEVVDMSIQTDNKVVQKETNKKSMDKTKSESSDSSYVEVRDLLLQTSHKCHGNNSHQNEEESSPKGHNLISSSNSDSSYIEVQDTSTQAKEGDKECGTNRTGPRNKSIFSDSESESEETDVHSSRTNVKIPHLEAQDRKLASLTNKCVTASGQRSSILTSAAFSSDDEDDVFKYAKTGTLEQKTNSFQSNTFSSDDDDCAMSAKPVKQLCKNNSINIIISSDEESSGGNIQKGNDNSGKESCHSNKQEVNSRSRKGCEQQKSRIDEILSSDEESFKDAIEDNSNVGWRYIILLFVWNAEWIVTTYIYQETFNRFIKILALARNQKYKTVTTLKRYIHLIKT